MFVDVKKNRRYTIDDESVSAFKNAVAKYLSEEGETEIAADDISDKIVETVLNDTLQNVFQAEPEYNSGINFDDYFMSVSFVCSNEEIRDSVCEAAALVMDEINDEKEEAHTKPVKDYRFFRRCCFLIDRVSLTEAVKELFNDSSIVLDTTHGVLEFYSSKKDYQYSEEELYNALSEHLNTTIIDYYFDGNAQEIYFITNKEVIS